MLFMVEVAVTNAYSKAGIPLTVQAIANVKISSNPSYVRNTRTGVNPATGRLGRALGEVNGLYGSQARRVIELAAKIYF